MKYNLFCKKRSIIKKNFFAERNDEYGKAGNQSGKSFGKESNWSL
jgi:hypothetical protein